MFNFNMLATLANFCNNTIANGKSGYYVDTAAELVSSSESSVCNVSGVAPPKGYPGRSGGEGDVWRNCFQDCHRRGI